MSSDEIGVALGAETMSRSLPIIVFVPSVDRDGSGIDQDFWTDETLAVLGKLYGGATALPAGRGSWWDDDAKGLLHESIVVVFCLVSGDLVRDPGLTFELAVHLRQMGRETNQGEVGVVIDGSYFGIRNFQEDDERT